MKTHYSTILLILTSLVALAQNSKQSFDKEIEAIFSEWNQPDTPGAAVAVVQKGKIIYSNEFGSANLEHQAPISTETKFQLNSVQNQIVAFAVLLLESQGKLSLEDNIRKYLPEMPDFGKPITIHHLLTHTHGIPNFSTLQRLAGWEAKDIKTREQALEIIYGLSANVYDAGDRYRFCDSGTLLASEIIAKVSGNSFVNFIETQIFKPLHMTNTVYGTIENSLIKNRSNKYSGSGENFKNENYFNYPIDFTLYSTAEDMARWMLNFGSPKVGNLDLIKKMQIPTLLNDGSSTHGKGSSSYAVYGQFTSPYKGLKRIEQNGRNYGFMTYIGQFPEQDFGVVVLGNSFDFHAEGAALKIADLFLKNDFIKEEIPVKKDSITKNDFIKLSIPELQKFCGTYWNKESSYMRKIYLKDGKLYYYRSEGNESELAPISKNTFVLTENPDSYSIRFEQKSDKELMIFAWGERGNEFQYFNEKFDLVTYDTEQLAEFTGLFWCENLNVLYKLLMQDGKITVSHNRSADFVITPYKSDKFTSDAYYFDNVEFERDKKGNINGLWIRTTNIGSQYFKKLSES
ncbi:serine hydrolase domain-containing protein [Maribacter sp. 2308TA10-17]|uniref:serine hydrolase domain-containing protein n=1 Tax=Maribacter sp. 2308TA10-17 TaxID=3386276 RepID=UPI0039BD8F61